jgi:hypothetical protein
VGTDRGAEPVARFCRSTTRSSIDCPGAPQRQPPKAGWRATGAQMPINANRETIALGVPATAGAATIRRQRLPLAARQLGGSRVEIGR